MKRYSDAKFNKKFKIFYGKTHAKCQSSNEFSFTQTHLFHATGGPYSFLRYPIFCCLQFPGGKGAWILCVYGDSSHSKVTVKSWLNKFKRGRWSVFDEPRTTALKTANTEDKVTKVLVLADH